MAVTEVRCKNCGKLLGKFDGIGEIKCPRANCNGKNVFNTKDGSVIYIHATNHVKMRDRTTSSGHTFR